MKPVVALRQSDVPAERTVFRVALRSITMPDMGSGPAPTVLCLTSDMACINGATRKTLICRPIYTFVLFIHPHRTSLNGQLVTMHCMRGLNSSTSFPCASLNRLTWSLGVGCYSSISPSPSTWMIRLLGLSFATRTCLTRPCNAISMVDKSYSSRDNIDEY